MKNIYRLIDHSTIRLLNHVAEPTIFGEPNNALLSFAIDDAIATAVGEGAAPPTIRFWVHERTVVLGIPDSRLPYLEKGINYLRGEQCNVIVRNSGGLAVLIDKDVLNMSLILPNKKEFGIHDGYDIMHQFIQYLFKDKTDRIDAYEIKGSYCPGDYDLSIGGIKFAGISQRRVRNGVAIQIYIDVSGSSFERASIVKNFYEWSIQGTETKYEYPSVNPNVMGSISDLLNETYTVQLVIEKIENEIDMSKPDIHRLLPEEEETFRKRLSQMHKRNEKVFV